jgi:flagellar biosynthetic protein FliR
VLLQTDPAQTSLEGLLSAGLLLTMRFGSAIVTMPVFSSPGIPTRVKAVLVLSFAVLLAPVAQVIPGTHLTLTAPALLSEVVVGLCFGLTLAFLNEALLFAASLMGTAFSFSLANLLDPNSMVETEVLGTVLSWMGVLVLLAAGLHRTMLAALMRTLITVPLGHAPAAMHTGMELADMASGIFLSGVQLAGPVVAASLLIEIAIGLVSRMAPALPAQIASVPIKTLVSYGVLIGSLALWPAWIEHRFIALLDAAQGSLHT